MPNDLLVTAAVLTVPYLAIYTATWVHELGHAVVGRAAGFRVTSVGVGTARPAAWVRVGSTVVFVGTRNVFQGVTFADLGLNPSRGRFAAYLAGGCAANAAAAAVAFLAVGVYPPGTWWLTLWAFGAINAVMAAANLIPFTPLIGPVRLDTDGARLVNTLRGRPQRFQVSLELNVVRVFAPLWRRIGDREMLAAGLASAARCWAAVRNPERAAALLVEVEALGAAPSDRLALLARLTRATVANAGGSPAEVESELDAAAAVCVAAGAEPVRVAVEVIRADFRAARGDAAGAAAALDAVAGSPAFGRDPALETTRRMVRYRLGDGPAGDPPGATSADALVRASAHLDAAKRAAAAGDTTMVEASAAAAVRAVDRFVAELLDPDDRGAAATARAYCSARIKDVAPDLAVSSTDDPAPVNAEIDAAAAKVRRRAVWGLAGLNGNMVFAAAVCVGTIASGSARDSDAAWFVCQWAAEVMLLSGVGVAYAVVTAVIRAAGVNRSQPWGRPLFGWAVGVWPLALVIMAGLTVASPLARPTFPRPAYQPPPRPYYQPPQLRIPDRDDPGPDAVSDDE